MNVVSIDELKIVGVFDHGIPNMERVVLQANESIDLGNYGLIIGIRGHEGQAFPLRDNFLWFGNGWLNKGDWLFVYTAPGTSKTTDLPNQKEKLYSVHWGKDQTLFQHKELIPLLIRMDAIQVPIGINALPPPV
ncbi:hypothetical protein [Janthinobacterium sp. B9-8]|uniref:hypothetical protein n=1 Tax=Janthinobacterium sp. B9-8 TaxID=1236179 RepID=UPI00061D00DE|nr:hypothetical protein [Janthinobacterium sp. B9-8]AMC34550.1 hypothetical protein VN23_08010 [Janthinobacterium sp. B9-8]